MKKKRKKKIPRMKSGRILASFMPKLNPLYEGSVCWHGCDKVSRIGLLGMSGGGGS